MKTNLVVGEAVVGYTAQYCEQVEVVVRRFAEAVRVVHLYPAVEPGLAEVHSMNFALVLGGEASVGVVLCLLLQRLEVH